MINFQVKKVARLVMKKKNKKTIILKVAGDFFHAVRKRGCPTELLAILESQESIACSPETLSTDFEGVKL